MQCEFFHEKKRQEARKLPAVRAAQAPNRGGESGKKENFPVFPVKNLHFTGTGNRGRENFSVKNLHLSAAETAEKS